MVDRETYRVVGHGKYRIVVADVMQLNEVGETRHLSCLSTEWC